MAKRKPAKRKAAPKRKPARKPATSRRDPHARMHPDQRRTLQLADPPAAAEHEPFGVSGTESLAGMIDREEYNPILRWPNAVRVYDEMRKSSPDVRAALQIMKLPILSAVPSIMMPANVTDTTVKKARDFVEWALLGTRMASTWRRTLRHLLLMLDFGFSAAELVFTVDTWNGRPVYRLHKLAPRLPRTLAEWQINRVGDLEAMVQYGPRLDTGVWQNFTIPADYLCVTVHEREGDNYNGISVLRPVYKPWYYLNQLEHIDMIRHHRWGAGLPEAKIKDNVRLSPDERRITENTLTSIAASETGFIITPSKLDFKLHTPQGGDTGMKDSMQYHSFAIARAILANFLNNAAEGLNTNRTESLINLFWQLILGVAEELAEDINRQVVRRLCDLNFDMTGLDYPYLSFTRINPVTIESMATALKDLGAAGFITPDDDLETWLRDIASAPPLPEELRRENREVIDATVIDAEADPADIGSQPADDETADAVIAASRRLHKIRDESLILSMADRILRAGAMGTRQISARDGAVLALASNIRAKRRLEAAQGGNTIVLAGKAMVKVGERDYWREPTDLERRVLSLAEIPDKLDTATSKLFAALVDIRKRQLRAAAEWLKANDDFADMKPDQIPMPEAAEVEREIRAMQDEIADFGAQQVRLELIRQGAPLTLDDEAGDLMLAESKKAVRSMLVAAAKASRDWMIADWRSDILESAMRLRRAGLTGDDLERTLISELEPAAETTILRDVKRKTNQAFALGRSREAEARKDVIAKVVQSCLLDSHSCRPCVASDGKEFPYGSVQQREHAPPYYRCDGKENCRCAQIYLYENPSDRSNRQALRDEQPDVPTLVRQIGREIATTMRDAMPDVPVQVDVHIPPPDDRPTIATREVTYDENKLVQRIIERTEREPKGE